MTPQPDESLRFFDAFTCVGPTPGEHPRQPWTLDALTAEMDHCSISGALTTSTACVLYDPMFENKRLIETLSKDDRLFPAWNVMPHWTGEFPEPERLTALMVENDVRAVTLNPVANGWTLTSSASRPLLTELAKSETLTIIDFRSEIQPGDLEWLLTEFAELPVLVRGATWGQQRLLIPLILNHRNLHVSFDSFQINNGLEWLVERGCEDQLVFASNAPKMAMGPHRCYVDYAAVSIEVKRNIASGNLTRLLKGLEPPPSTVNAEEDEFMALARRGVPQTATIFDFHAHILDEGLNGGGGRTTMIDGGPKGTLAMARRLGVDGVGLMSWNGTVGGQGAVGNDCVKAALDALPDSYWGLFTCDPVRESRNEVERQIAAVFQDPRFIGFKPYHTYGVPFDDPAYEPWWEYGERRGLYALLHVTRSDLSEADVLCGRYPNMTFVVVHAGSSYKMADRAIEISRKRANFRAEITYTTVPLGIIDHLVQGCGPDRVLYGSDQPMRDPRQQFGWVLFSRLSPDAKRRVLGLNALDILKPLRNETFAKFTTQQ